MINTPPAQYALPVVKNAGGQFTVLGKEWTSWFTQVFNICFAVSQSGTTANRPTTNLWPGRMYFDTSLGANGKPIWVNKASSGWVLADGTAA